MAITQSTKPYILMTALNDTLSTRVNVNYLYWYSKEATAGDDIKIVDGDGDIVWEDVADGSNYTKLFPVKSQITGLKIATLDSGKLFVLTSGVFEYD